MTWGIPTDTFLQIHVVLSLVGIASGLVVLYGLLTGQPLGVWTAVFLATTILTGVTNATSESLNRIAKLEARMAYGFRNPENQRRRVRIACTRARRRPLRSATASKTRPVIGQKPDPG